MFQQLLLLFSILAAVYANGEFAILHSPNSVEFIGNREIEQSSLKEVLTAGLGYTGKQKDSEHCIAIRDPFSMPKALVAIAIDGIEKLPVVKDKTKIIYPLIVDEAEETTWQAIRSRVEERSNDDTLVRINLSDGVDALGQSALGELKPANMEKLKFLSSEVEEDCKFVEEIQLLHAIADNASSAKKHDSGTDVYWLVITSFNPVLELHGNNSAPAKEAYTLLSDAIEHVSKAFVNTYDGKIIIAAFTNDAWKVRNARSVLERQRRDTPQDDKQDKQNDKKGDDGEKNSTTIAPNTVERTDVQANSETSDKSDEDHKDNNIYNNTIGQADFSGRAKVYNEDYPVIFNIILWFCVVFFFSLLAICIAIADMDPGRDSIIYRMTSNRMKKDN
ncbi:ATPase H(+)-transporting accessory protein 2 isoform X2 [Solenopsis invicta]|uniref:ATPase H(+)-transporting accessory protein 2 isoform X2 n=1 Tax=Solenopsis invicta TaxID=13686 RepID=UPI0005960531|nr:ATPase H(+)-transporting accessory protein 2 isoform X2 [Solenopsis invicta]